MYGVFKAFGGDDGMSKSEHLKGAKDMIESGEVRIWGPSILVKAIRAMELKDILNRHLEAHFLGREKVE